MAFGDSDLAMMLSTADFGVDVVCGGVTVPGIPDVYDERSGMAGADVDFADRMRVVTIQTGSLPALAKEVAITVNGVAGKVRDPVVEADGALTKVYWVTP